VTAKITACAFKKKKAYNTCFPDAVEFGDFGNVAVKNKNNLPGVIQSQNIAPTGHKRSYYDRERYKPLYNNADLPVDEFGNEDIRTRESY
jgi:hypothetical protein